MITHEKFRNTITDIELKGNELSNGEFEVQALPLTNIMYEYSMQYVLLERDVKRYFELSHNPTSNTNPNEIRPYIEWANELMELEKQILSKAGAKDV